MRCYWPNRGETRGARTYRTQPEWNRKQPRTHTHTLEHRVMLTLYMCAIETLPLYATACVLSLIGWRSVPTFSFGWMRALPSCYPPLMQVTGAQRPGRTRTHTHTHTRLHTRRPDGPRPRWLSRWATTQSVQPPHSHLPLLLGLFLFLSPIFLSSSTLYLLVTGESRRCQTLCKCQWVFRGVLI